MESSKEKEAEDSAVESESDDENDKLRKSALDKLEKASEDSVFGQASYLRTGLNNLVFCWKSIFAFTMNVTISVYDYSLASH